jgi:hypothetical protein
VPETIRCATVPVAIVLEIGALEHTIEELDVITWKDVIRRLRVFHFVRLRKAHLGSAAASTFALRQSGKWSGQ